MLPRIGIWLSLLGLSLPCVFAQSVKRVALVFDDGPRPADAELQNNLGAALAQTGRPAEALRRFQEALRLRPDFARARENLERATRAAGGR